MLPPLRSTRSMPEPKAIGQFMSSGHPHLAFALAMSWMWRGVVGATLTLMILLLLRG